MITTIVWAPDGVKIGAFLPCILEQVQVWGIIHLHHQGIHHCFSTCSTGQATITLRTSAGCNPQICFHKELDKITDLHQASLLMVMSKPSAHEHIKNIMNMTFSHSHHHIRLHQLQWQQLWGSSLSVMRWCVSPMTLWKPAPSSSYLLAIVSWTMVASGCRYGMLLHNPSPVVRCVAWIWRILQA